jgi:sulfate transport system permease protein
MKALRRSLITLAALYLGFLVLLPLASIVYGAFSQGLPAFFAALLDPDTLHALKLTLLLSAISVPLNLTFGVAAAWAIARFEFKGKSLLTTLIDLPFSVSPVVAGLLFVLLFGRHGWLGEFFEGLGLPIIFAFPGILLATLFVTFPIAARELIPLMQELGPQEEEAARTLGASGWQTFFWVTFPNIRWGLVYAVILANARAMGEFGAVSVVSGQIRNLTVTLPLQVEILYNEYQQTAAFSAATLLCLMAVATLALKAWAARQGRRES